MYNPQRFKGENLNEAFDLMERYPFATVISIAEDKPFVSHLPLTPEKTGEDQLVLIGHLARPNPHWKLLEKSPTTILFQGAHTFITPKWYAENDVPTWNYSVVHVTGQAQLIEDANGIIECLQKLSSHVERQWPSGWEFFIPEDLSSPEILAKSIVGFRIHVEAMNFKKKLSQNRSSHDRAGVMKGLATRNDGQSQEVLADMKKLYASDGELK